MSTENGISKQRMGEIALLYLERQILKDSVPMDPSKLRREICTTAKEVGIEIEEAVSFANIMLANAFTNVLQGLNKEKRPARF
ncbi:MAG: hypothetical protein Q7K40_03370 [bacterium]|nr:hypothetical protein [bacterium]